MKIRMAKANNIILTTSFSGFVMLPPFNEDKDLENEIDDHINLYKDPWNRFYKIVIESQVRSKNEGTRWKINQNPIFTR